MATNTFRLPILLKAKLLLPILFLISACGGSAQDTPAERHRMATNHVKRVAAELSASFLTEIRSLEDWKKHRPEWHRQLMDMLGLNPLPARTPLKARITGVLDRSTYRIEKLVFQSLPGLYVTGNFYVPKNAEAPLPTILYLCGHAPHPIGAKVNYQDRAAWFASHGFACMILDTLEFGEVPGIHHGTHDLNLWHWLSLGYTPAGTEVWNAMRALDYLETRPEVDARRFGVTGISGGGAITWYLAAVDERVQVAAPVCSTFTFGSQAANWRASGQCDCIYFHNTYGWEFPMVAALIAPRPLLIMSGRLDLDFPPDGYHEVFGRAQKIYELYTTGEPDRIREVDADVGHSDTPQFLREAREWMRRWLQHQSMPLGVETNALPREAAEDLACLTQMPSDAINYRIQNQLTGPVTLKKPPSRSVWPKRRKDLLEQLNQKVFRWFPKETIPFETRVSRNSGGWAPKYADYKDVSFQTEMGVRIRAQLLTPKRGIADAPVLLYVKRPGDSIYFMDLDELLPVLGHYSVLILNPRFSEVPISPADHASIEMTSAWTGRTIAAMQVWDILRTVKWLFEEEKFPASALSFYGKGDLGILGLYAALSDGRIQQVILNDPPSSHWQHPALINVLRVTDIPEVAGALAPRRLVSLTPLPEAFNYTRKLYRMQRASAQMVQSGSLPEALEVWRHP